MKIFLYSIFFFIGTLHGSGTTGELDIFVHLPAEVGLPTQSVNIKGDATVQDLVDLMNELLTNVRRKYDGIVFSGELKPTTSTLADSWISNGATVSLVKTSISDIELLFEMLSVHFLFYISDNHLTRFCDNESGSMILITMRKYSGSEATRHSNRNTRLPLLGVTGWGKPIQVVEISAEPSLQKKSAFKRRAKGTKSGATFMETALPKSMLSTHETQIIGSSLPLRSTGMRSSS